MLSTVGVTPSAAGVPAPPVAVADPRTQVRVFQADNFRLNGMDFVMVAPNGTEISQWQNVDFNHMTKWLFDMPASSQITMVAETRKYPGGIVVNASTNFPLLPGGPVYVCAVPAPDLMSPCELTLERFCGRTRQLAHFPFSQSLTHTKLISRRGAGENRTARQCNACAGQHQRQLGAAGCLPDEISDFCRVGPTEFDLVTISSSFTPVAHPTEEANVAFANLAPSFPVVEILIGGAPVAANLHFREGQPYVLTEKVPVRLPFIFRSSDLIQGFVGWSRYRTIKASETVRGSVQVVEARRPAAAGAAPEPLARMSMKIVAGKSYHIFLVQTLGGRPELNWGDDIE